MISQPVLAAFLASRARAAAPRAKGHQADIQPWPVNDIVLGALLGKTRSAEEIAAMCGVSRRDVAHRIARIG